MKKAISLIEENLPIGCSEIVSGGAGGIDSAAKILAERIDIKYTCFLPEYEKFGKEATLVRNKKIVEYSDQVIAFWDFESKGTQNTIISSLECNKPVRLIQI